MARESKTEPMIEHRITLAVRYPLTGAVPSLGWTTDALTDGFNESVDDETYDAEVEVVSQSAKTVRVPVKDGQPAPDEPPVL